MDTPTPLRSTDSRLHLYLDCHTVCTGCVEGVGTDHVEPLVASTKEVAPLTPRRQQEHSHPRPRCCPHHRHSKRRRCCRRLRRRAAATCAPRNTRCHRERCPVPLKCRMQLDARRRSIRLLDRPGRVCFHRSRWWWSTRSESRSRPVSPDSLFKALWRTASVHARLLKHAPAVAATSAAAAASALPCELFPRKSTSGLVSRALISRPDEALTTASIAALMPVDRARSPHAQGPKG